MALDQGGARGYGQRRGGGKTREEERRSSMRRIATSYIRAWARLEKLPASTNDGERRDSRESSPGLEGGGGGGGGGSRGERLLHELVTVGCPLDAVLLTAAVDACAQMGDVTGAYALLRSAGV